MSQEWFARPVLFEADIDRTLGFYVNRLGFTQAVVPGQLMSKVPNRRFSGHYTLDFIGMRFLASASVLAGKKSREINGQIFENGTIDIKCTPRLGLPAK